MEIPFDGKQSNEKLVETLQNNPAAQSTQSAHSNGNC